MDIYSELKSQKLGYYRFNDPQAFKYLKWFFKIPMITRYDMDKEGKLKYPFLYYPLGMFFLRLTQRKLKNLYMMDYNTEYGMVDAWRGIDVGTAEWHNDMPDGYNVAFLMYLCDTDSTTGGGIQFRARDFTHTEIVYPQKYDIVVLDQDLRYEHRVLPLYKQINRDIANIEFNIEKVK